jgi:hypothetical protein
MNPEHRDGWRKLDPRLLAAYADGELDPRQQAAVENQLATDREARNEVAHQRAVTDAFRNASIPEPDESRWNDSLAIIRLRLGKEKAWRSGRIRGWWVGIGMAAAVLAFALVLRYTQRTIPVPETSPALPNGPLEVVSADDVVITSIDDDAREAVVVGDMPVRDPLVLADHGEIRIDQMLPEQGMQTQYSQEGVTNPMIITVPGSAPPEAKMP